MDKKYYESKLLSYIGESFCQHLKNHRAIVAGGSIRSLFLGEEIKDLDTYFRSEEDLRAFIEDINLTDNNHVKVVTSRSITFSPNQKEDSKLTIQLVYFDYYASAEKIFEDYDFSVCMGAYDFFLGDFVFDKQFFEDNATKKISVNKGTKFPLISLFRVSKYKSKGYDFPQKQLLEFCKAINKFNYEDEEVVKDQTQGFYGIVEDQKWEPFEVGEIEYAISKRIEYFEYNGSKIDCLTNKIISINEYEKFKSKFVLSEFKPFKVYKYVKDSPDGIYSSYYRSSFKYEVGKEVSDGNRGIYVNKSILADNMYSNQKDAVKIEILVNNFEDVIDDGRIRKGVVLRVIEKSGTPILVNKLVETDTDPARILESL
jgi:hypothetical protein